MENNSRSSKPFREKVTVEVGAVEVEEAAVDNREVEGDG